MKHILEESDLLLNEIEKNQDVVKKELDYLRPVLESKRHAIEKARCLIDQQFDSLETSLQYLLFTARRYQKRREELAKLRKCVIGAHENFYRVHGNCSDD